ncbi:hypothetical protein DB347_06005 [Opitutaceae bacterium EW11]|nr:hypothetical protein DB347_06005 [Opitutaceae bacterium EW11]
MVRDPEDLARLHFVNSLFAQVTGSDLYLANQIKEAIAFSLSELEQQTTAHPELATKYDAAFANAAARLLEKLFHQKPDHGFFHWDAARTLESATPLFARTELMIGLKSLARFRSSTLLVTNLRPALLPPEKRKTERRQREYEDTLAFIRDLAASRTSASAELQLIFV